MSETGVKFEFPQRLFIDGAWTDAAHGDRFDVVNPATGEVLARIADGRREDARQALDAAVASQVAWAETPPRERSEILRRAYDLIIEHIDELAMLITLEMGKPLADARGEVSYGAEFFRWFAEEAVRIGGDHTLSGDGRTRIVVTREPVGPCVVVTPWNFPLAMGTRKIGPALAAGCTVVFKPAEQTPLTALYLAHILSLAGLPDGVVNVVTTTAAAEVVGYWLDSGQARKLSFTGSTEVGRILLAQASKHVMRTSMELGGNAPFIVCHDADIDTAVEGAITAKMRNMGEACTAANRLYVHADVIEEFTKRFAERMAALRLGPGWEDGVQVGPLIDHDALRKVESLVRDAVDRGARVATGGESPVDGLLYPPTVLVDVALDCELASAEIFGPVAPIFTFTDEAEAVRLANDTEWGLVGYIFTQDIDRAFRLAGGLEVGMVGLNTGLVSNPAGPFGGVKSSGLGREGGRWGIDEYLEYKYFAIPRR
ncbi:NAD-dependent succinate-semialdehyde dehydrogenase [Microbacterium sp. LWH7-1.2]|uniref:NAD-dependent succinate-semialdehyde dehydrogenase n=1 Tax=Microbacterium sp. LWH7-1.2 TaxID=3135257 RepID=UPI00313A497A